MLVTNKTIPNIYCGDKEISAVYFRGKTVWEKESGNYFVVTVDSNDSWIRYTIDGVSTNIQLDAGATKIHTIKPQSLKEMFYSEMNLKSVDFSNFDTSDVTDMSGMFNQCYTLCSVNLSNIDTNKVTDMNNMFAECFGLTALDISNLDIRQVSDMGSMFLYCMSLKCLKIKNFGAHKDLNVSQIFHSCSELGSDNAGESVNRKAFVDTLLTNSFDRAAAGYTVSRLVLPDEVFGRLTTSERAAIANKGYSIIKSSNYGSEK